MPHLHATVTAFTCSHQYFKLHSHSPTLPDYWMVLPNRCPVFFHCLCLNMLMTPRLTLDTPNLTLRTCLSPSTSAPAFDHQLSTTLTSPQPCLLDHVLVLSLALGLHRFWSPPLLRIHNSSLTHGPQKSDTFPGSAKPSPSIPKGKWTVLI